MPKPTTAELNTLLLALTERVNELLAANQALAAEVVRAHGRIDHAADVFAALRKAVTPQRPRGNARPVNKWRAALDELREEDGTPGAYISGDRVRERMETRAAMAANSAAAQH